MKNNKAALLVGLILSALPNLGHAECMACTRSHGVRITLKSGAIEEGYLPWNKFATEALVNGYALSGRAEAQEILEKWRKPGESEQFGYWIDLMNLVVQKKISLQDKNLPPTLTLYRELARIKFPIERYVVVEGTAIEVPVADIAGVSISATHKLVEETTGIPSHSKADIKLLNNAPRFTVQKEGSVGADVYAVYGESVTLSAMLEHLFSNGDFMADVLVNGTRIRGGFSGAGPATPLEEAPSLGPLIADCQAFLKKLGELDRAKCLRENEENEIKLGKMPLDDPGRSALFDRQHDIRSRCSKTKQLDRHEFKSLGNQEKLRSLGIIQSGYGWD